MKNSADDNAVSLRLIEDDVFTLLETADTRVNPITSPTQTGRVSKPVKNPGELIKVVFGLFFAPGIYCVIEYLCQIRNTFRSKETIEDKCLSSQPERNDQRSNPKESSCSFHIRLASCAISR